MVNNGFNVHYYERYVKHWLFLAGSAPPRTRLPS
jgi:hypothetical protein